MSRLVAIDPGTRKLGVAVFESNDAGSKLLWLVDAFAIRATSIDVMLKKIGEARPRLPHMWGDEVVIEKPHVRGRGGRADPNDILQIAIVAGYAAGAMSSARVIFATPKEWKGDVEKTIQHARMDKQLHPVELRTLAACVKTAGAAGEDIKDAVGLGLWQLERTGRRWPM